MTNDREYANALKQAYKNWYNQGKRNARKSLMKAVSRLWVWDAAEGYYQLCDRIDKRKKEILLPSTDTEKYD